MHLGYGGAGMGSLRQRTQGHFYKRAALPARCFPPGLDKATGVCAHQIKLHVVHLYGAGGVLASVVTSDVEKRFYETMLGLGVFFVNGKGEGGENIRGLSPRGYFYFWTQLLDLSGAKDKIVPPGFIPSHNGAPPVRLSQCRSRLLPRPHSPRRRYLIPQCNCSLPQHSSLLQGGAVRPRDYLWNSRLKGMGKEIPKLVGPVHQFSVVRAASHGVSFSNPQC